MRLAYTLAAAGVLVWGSAARAGDYFPDGPPDHGFWNGHPGYGFPGIRPLSEGCCRGGCLLPCPCFEYTCPVPPNYRTVVWMGTPQDTAVQVRERLKMLGIPFAPPPPLFPIGKPPLILENGLRKQEKAPRPKKDTEPNQDNKPDKKKQSDKKQSDKDKQPDK